MAGKQIIYNEEARHGLMRGAEFLGPVGEQVLAVVVVDRRAHECFRRRLLKSPGGGLVAQRLVARTLARTVSDPAVRYGANKVIGYALGLVAIIVIAREFLTTGLRLLAVSKGRILAADPIGKHKTSWQIATVIFFLVLLSYTEFTSLHAGTNGQGPVWSALWHYGGWAVSGIAVALTLYSGIDYLWRHRSMLEVD